MSVSKRTCTRFAKIYIYIYKPDKQTNNYCPRVELLLFVCTPQERVVTSDKTYLRAYRDYIDFHWALLLHRFNVILSTQRLSSRASSLFYQATHKAQGCSTNRALMNMNCYSPFFSNTKNKFTERKRRETHAHTDINADTLSNRQTERGRQSEQI